MLRFTLVLLCAGAVGPKALTQAREANEKAHFEEVTRLLRDADLAALAPDERADAEFLLAVAELALGHDALSQKAFTHLWREFPDYALPPYTAPKVAAASERARKQVPIVLRTERAGEVVKICGDGLSQRANVRFTWTTGAGERSGTVAKVPPCFTARVPSDAVGYYVLVAVDGDVRVKAGTRAAPVALSPALGEVAAERPWYKKWWPWAIVGGVVALGAAAAIVGVEVAHQHQPGTVRFTVAQP